MNTLLICNASLVNEGEIVEADVFIADGRIQQVGANLSHLSSDRFIDAKGLYIFPGIIDTQFSLASSKFNEESLLCETKAAVAGGITSVMLLPHIGSEKQTGLPTDSQLEQLAPNLINNFSFYAAIEPLKLECLNELSNQSHICATYASMAGLNDLFRFDNEALLSELIESSPIPVVIDAEDMPSVLESEECYRQIYGDNIPFKFHSIIRGPDSLSTAVKSVLKVSNKLEKAVHLLHVSSTQEVELIESARKRNTLVTADVCSHFLTFSEADYEEKSQLLKYNPAIKSDIDRASLVQGLLDNNINNICSGHMPYTYEQKQGNYFFAASGMPQAQFALPSILEHYHDQIFTLQLIVEKTSHAVAEKFSIKDRGYIKEGCWADLVLVDLDESFIARNEDVLSLSGWTIFAGNEFRSSVIKTIVNGEVVWSKADGLLCNGAGALLEFSR